MLEHVEELDALDGGQLDMAAGADRLECGADLWGGLQPADQHLPAEPGDVAAR